MGGAWIIEGKKREKMGTRVESGIKKREEEMKGGRANRQGLQSEIINKGCGFKGEALRSSASVVLMAGESMVDEAYYVAKIMPDNGSLTDDKMNKHGEERGAATRFPI